MHASVAFLLSSLAAFALALPTVDYGPCDYNGNPNCPEIMDNTACFLNPKSVESIFGCISGGREGVCACYGCLGYLPVTQLIANTTACAGVPIATPKPLHGDKRRSVRLA